MELSSKVSEMQHSPIRRFNKKARDAEERGIKIYRMNIGQPDIETPSCFMEAVNDWDSKIIAYEESAGNRNLQNAICDYFEQYGLHYTEDNIMVTSGGSEALSMVFAAIMNPGDEVMTAEPFYANYHAFITKADGAIAPITAKAEEGYHFANKELLEASITPATKAILCTSPGNPTGRVLTDEDMRVIADFAKEHDLWLIADEVYREFVYDGRKATSFAMLEDIQDRVIIVDSVSKRFSACGARIGYIVTRNEILMDALMKIAEGRLCSSTLDQAGATALYHLPQSYYEDIRSIYEQRRDVAYKEILKIPNVICHKPGGAFYMTIKLPIDDCEKFLIFMLDEFEHEGETAMFSPAKEFYATPGLGHDEIRIAYVLNEEKMKRGTELIKLGIEAYNEKYGK